MLRSKPIHNIDNPPFFFRIRGKFFMNFMMLCSGVAILGLIGALVCIILGYGWSAFIIFIITIIANYLIYLRFVSMSKPIPFKDIKKTADIISHINFNKVTEC